MVKTRKKTSEIISVWAQFCYNDESKTRGKCQFGFNLHEILFGEVDGSDAVNFLSFVKLCA